MATDRLQEESTRVIKLEEEEERLVQAMIDYFYTTTYTVEIPEKYASSAKCPHEEDHSCSDETCYLSSFGLVIGMYSLGDKYDVPGLRNLSCTRLRELFAGDVLGPWSSDVIVWKYAYQHSRKTDTLREVLNARICNELFSHQGWLLRKHPRFHAFIEEAPEVTAVLLKKTMEYYESSMSSMDRAIVSSKAVAALKDTQRAD